MPNPIYSIAAKTENGQTSLLKAGLPEEVRDAIANALHQGANDLVWLRIDPSFDLSTKAAKNLAALAEAPQHIPALVESKSKELPFDDGSKLLSLDANNLNPLRKDPSVIPPGNYCYHGSRPRREGEPEFTEDGRPIHYLNYCPYMGSRTFNGVQIAWCEFLNEGSLDGSLGNRTEAEAEEEHRKLVEHFGSEEKLNEAAPLFLLWDSCKECGINEGDEEG